MQERLAAIDSALAKNDLRKAEVQIAKMLKTETLTAAERSEVLLRRANARLVAGRPEDALREVEEMLILQPDLVQQSRVRVLLGDIYFARFVLAEFGFADRANTEKALVYFDSVIENTPDYAHIGWVYYQRGCIHLSENKVDDAIQNLKEALKHTNDPAYLHAYCYERLGFVELFENRDPHQAVEHFDNAITNYPPGISVTWLSQVHILRSRALRELKDYKAALNAASAALDTLDPNAQDFKRAHTETHLAIGEVLAHIPGREADAINHLLQFLQNTKRPIGVDVTWSRVYESIGNLSLKLERYDQAIEAYQASLQFNPYHPWVVNIHYQITRCYYRMRSYEKVIEAVAELQQAAEQENQSVTDYRVYYVLANAHFALEQYQHATTAYQVALELAPPGADNLNKIKQYLRYSHELTLN